MTIEGWHIIDEPGAPPLATKRDDAWAFINEAGGGVDLEVRHCNETQRAVVPVKVLEALLAAWRAREGGFETLTAMAPRPWQSASEARPTVGGLTNIHGHEQVEQCSSSACCSTWVNSL